MSMVGDGPEGQPTEGVTLASLAASLDDGETQEQATPGESEQDESADESEQVEASGEESEEEEAAEESEDEQQDDTFTIKVDGKDVTLTRAEMIEQAQKGFDYTQKTMAVAEQRKAVDTERARVDELREHASQALNEQVGRLQAIEQFMTQQLGQPPSIELAQHDAQQYLVQKELFEHRKGQLEHARAAIHNLTQEQQRQRQASILEQADATEARLRDTLPGWNDEMLANLSKYGAGLGLTPEKLEAAFVQEGFWQVLHKAKAYDELQAKKAEMKPVAKLQKVAKPGNNNQPPQLARRQEAMKRHKAAPSISSLADLL